MRAGRGGAASPPRNTVHPDAVTDVRLVPPPPTPCHSWAEQQRSGDASLAVSMYRLYRRRTRRHPFEAPGGGGGREGSERGRRRTKDSFCGAGRGGAGKGRPMYVLAWRGRMRCAVRCGGGTGRRRGEREEQGLHDDAAPRRSLAHPTAATVNGPCPLTSQDENAAISYVVDVVAVVVLARPFRVVPAQRGPLSIPPRLAGAAPKSGRAGRASWPSCSREGPLSGRAGYGGTKGHRFTKRIDPPSARHEEES